ncbi:DENN domain-containing protein 1A-like isoform X2 [Hippocampus zosterae]|uniref:DENN domain-containing protein 1A-like isoform X2 n=1 Tax=Hippocampus zosterae TaxID=109293 RepID=UPI00223E7472|nr:DENN domain-containing protein 1A-like isoform X2 [Hippocampus zosterae]
MFHCRTPLVCLVHVTRQQYLLRISLSSTASQCVADRKMESRLKESPASAFEVYMEVFHPGTQNSEPAIRRKFPEDFQDEETIKTVPKFCFPFCLDSVMINQMDQNFTFVLTDINSKHRFGFCRLSSNSHTCYCLLSYLPWFDVYYKLLNIIADYTVFGQEINFQDLLVSLHTLSIPEPGVPVHLAMHFYFTVPDLKELPRIPENRNLTEYFLAVDVNNMLQLYASMLYERRILICCSTLSTLTACVHGSVAMLYPMHWQHVYIPVLPQHLLDYCCAPMPYLIGVHSSLMEKVQGMAMEDVVILNVDTNTLETPYNDLQSLPQDVVSSLKSRLRKFSTTPGDGVARAFLKSQAALFGSYRNALQIELGEPITFNEETFVNHRLSAMRVFLQNAIQLQLFKQFIDGRLVLLNSGEGFNDIFEEEINNGNYAGNDTSYHQWLITVKKGSGAILNTVKTKANPAMKTVYKFAKDHAKMGIKEVKSRLKHKENVDNGSGIIAGDNDFLAIRIKSGRSLQTLDEHRTNWQFGLRQSPVQLKKSNCDESLEGSHDPSQRYYSLRKAEWIEEHDSNLGIETPSPLPENLSNASILANFFSCLDEHEPLPLAKSLEDLKSLQDYEKLQTKFTSQEDLHFCEHSQLSPDLKLHSALKLLSKESDQSEIPSWEPMTCKKTQSAQLLTQTNDQNSNSTGAESQDLSSNDTIAIPRPHVRKSTEFGMMLAPLIGQSQSKPNEERTKIGGQEFRKALSKTSDVFNIADDHMDLISLLDPLNKSPRTSSISARDEMNIDTHSTSCQTTIPPRSYPLSQSSFQPHHQISPTVFTQSFRHSLPQMQYLSGGRRTPLNPVSGPPCASYLHSATQPPHFPSLSEVYKQQLPDNSTLLPSYRMGNSSPCIPLLHSSTSTRALSGLTDSMPIPGTASNTLTRPLEMEEGNQKTQDLFGDLLTMIKPTAPLQKSIDQLQKTWETFD